MTLRSLSLLTLAFACVSGAQDRLVSMPRYDRFDKLSTAIRSSVKRASVEAIWTPDGSGFYYSQEGKGWKFDLKTSRATEAAPPEQQQPRAGGPNDRRPWPERGRQFAMTFSADGKLKAAYRDRNVWLSNADGSDERQITTEGDAAKRTKCGSASWVYGEELGVREAMWFSPDGKFLAYYQFDESLVKDYYLAMDVVKVQNTLDVEAYPKAGADNPSVQLMVFELATGKKVKVDHEFAQKDLGYYVYEVRWSPEGDELLFNRTNRKQNTMELVAANPTTGACRAVVRESHPNSWTDPSPNMRWLAPKAGKRRAFLWMSERNGYRNIYLGDLSGSPLRPITQHQFEVQDVAKVDEAQQVLFYMARSAPNPYRLQLHRINLDGSNDKRLTDPEFHHQVDLSPTGSAFIDTAETLDTPPVVRVCDANGRILQVLAQSDMSVHTQLGLQRVERIKFKAADGVTDLYGTLMKPSDFDPAKKYPILVEVYGGPESGGGVDRFQLPSATTELGFLVVDFDNRGTSGRGKAFKDMMYGKLGIVEIDDQAAGVKALRQRPYVDGTRVGITGTSYGGYASAMAILRHPDVFQAAVACSSVTDWLNYDTIYTERYMGLPWDGENKAGYEAGSAMQYASNLKGRLLLYYGTADNNVHPSNTYQLARALQRAGKGFSMMAGPDQGHSAISSRAMLEYLMEHLVVAPGR